MTHEQFKTNLPHEIGKVRGDFVNKLGRALNSIGHIGRASDINTHHGPVSATGGPIPLRWTTRAKLRNACGFTVELGQILQVDDAIPWKTDALTKEERWEITLDGITPTAPFSLIGVAMENAPPASIIEYQLDGICPAIVNIIKTTHGMARPIVDSRVLQSSDVGPVKLMWTPSGGVTGEHLCFVKLGAWEPVLVELCAIANATRNIPYQAKLAHWDPALGGWCYDGAPTVYAVDHRYGMALAEAGWKGLYMPMPSTIAGHDGVIYVCVSLDCEAPPEGCECTTTT